MTQLWKSRKNSNSCHHILATFFLPLSIACQYHSYQTSGFFCFFLILLPLTSAQYLLPKTINLHFSSDIIHPHLIFLMWKLCLLTLAKSCSGMPSSGSISETSFYLFQGWKSLQTNQWSKISSTFLIFKNLKISVIIVIIVEKNPNATECSENSCQIPYVYLLFFSSTILLR